jgi:Zn-dependent protease with chaperone function
MISRRMRTCLFGIALAAAAWAARKPGSPLRPSFLNVFSKEQDVEIGRQNAALVLEQYELVKSKAAQAYVEKLGQKLAAQPEAKSSGFTFSFTLLHVDEINAFALPGGPMFIYTGLLKATDNEAQLAGVMGHEMAHVILRHGTHEATKANGLSMGAGWLAGVLGGGKIAESVLGMGANSAILKFSRDAETEADALGSHLMSGAGYDPVQMAKFFEKLAANGRQPPQILSDHPNPGNREEVIRAEMQTLPARKYAVETGEFARVKKELAALPPPVKKPAAGAIAPGSGVPAPGASADWQRYRGTGYSIDYPQGWQVFGAGALAPKDGVIAQSGAVGFGAMIAVFTPARGHVELKASTEELVRNLIGENPGMSVTGASRDATVGGSAGLITILKGESPFGGAEIDTLMTVVRGQELWYAVFVAPEKDQARVEVTFRHMMESVRFE